MAFRLFPVFFAVLLSSTVSCSLTFTYPYLDWMVLWKIDQYLDLNSHQKDLLAGRLADILVRHRRETLPQYREFLHSLHMRVQEGLRKADVAWVMQSYEKFRTDLNDQFVAGGQELLPTLKKTQIQYLEQAFQDENAELKSRLSEIPSHRLAERAEDFVDWFEEWIGPLSPDQRREVIRLNLALPDTLKDWFDYQQHRQQAFLVIAQKARRGVEFRDALREWLVVPYLQAPLGFLRSRERMRQSVTTFTLHLDQLLTPQQRHHAVRELHDLEEDLQRLAEP